MVRFQILITEEQKERLRKEARRLNISVTAIIRIAIDEYLERLKDKS